MKVIASLIGRAVRDADGSQPRPRSPPRSTTLVIGQAGVRLLGRTAVREYLLCLFVAAVGDLPGHPAGAALRRCAWGAMAEVRDRDVHDDPDPAARRAGDVRRACSPALLRRPASCRSCSSVFEDSHRAAGAAHRARSCWCCSAWSTTSGASTRPTKFAGQALAGAVMALQGIAIVWLPIGGTLVLDPLTSVLLTVLVVVVAVNAINFVDGLDGLAAGIVGIGALAFFAYSYLLSFEYGFTRATLAALVSAVLAGMCAGFLPHNLNPARVFMGDTGSMLIGLLLRQLGDHPGRPARPQRGARPHLRARRCSRSCCRLAVMAVPAARHAAGRRTPHPRRPQPVLARTSSTCTTACSSSATASAAPCCSCTAGPGCSPSRPSGWPSSRSGSPRSGSSAASRCLAVAVRWPTACAGARTSVVTADLADRSARAFGADAAGPLGCCRARRPRRTDLLRPDDRRPGDPCRPAARR